MRKHRPEKAELELAYLLEPSRIVLARHYRVCPETIQDWLEFYNIPRRSQSEANKAVYAQHPEYLEYRHAAEFKASCSLGWQKHSGVIRRSHGRPHSLEHRRKLSIAHKKLIKDPKALQKLLQSQPKATQRAKVVNQAAWHNPVERARRLSKILKAVRKRPTSLEQRIIKVVEEYGLPYKYTGDGSFIIAGLNPDFVNCNGVKVALDIFGDYWHTIKANKPYATEQGRKAIFAGYGWELIVLWESEMKKLTDQEIVERLSESQNKDKEVLCQR